MKRIWGYGVSLLAAGTLVGVALPACATNDQSIFIHGALAPSANRAGGACIYNSDPQQAELFQAELDIGLSDSYFGILLIGNQLIARGDPANNRAESNRAHINGGIVRVTEPNGKFINEFTSLATGFNDPQSNNSPGYSAVGLVLIDAPTRQILLEGKNTTPPSPLSNRQISKTVLINVKVFGTTLGGKDLESGEYQLPMQVCNGCLVSFDGFDPAKVTPARPNNCDRAADVAAGASTTGPCRAGQDLPLSCRLCKGLRTPTPDVCDPNVP